MNEPPVVCMRHMKLESAGDQNEVVVQIWQAQEIAAEGPDGSFYQCEFEITGLPEAVRARGTGVDSMQALVSALTGVNYHLRPYIDSLTWLGDPYDEWGVYVYVQDAGRRRRIQEILDEEEYAIERRLRSRQRSRQNDYPGSRS